ncbi:outer membrane protein assembly factor BamA [Paradevosia shaoguanensis]|uniref:Outer membrane protein assembly factor BamA n=1 Tax=Paradevosia shaoguanensis TaxID=1335043 RepID=A0AA41QLL0_9HYPH|nr:outer membrane protein assembly factor BamA [Paradevosia shaoguanensis]MCF1742361.1 outer membrane protein assembly factor BamA [Paradevosia shaoguanensis]MCI0126844.1 outer membrane protein assembly factor BamA [Paradevosia shaoguanensis]CDP54263.1 Outer membrane protein assembly factor YaeT precur sor [Devosia sp. DBB001]
MIDPTKLMRGVFVALALFAAGSLPGAGGAIVGVQQVQAQSKAPLIASVLFDGNRRFSDAQLLTMVDTATRGTYSAQGVASDAESIRLAYDKAGFNNVTVTPKVENVEGGRVRVTFVVNEGNRAGIAAINFTGNNAVNGGTLKGVIRTKESGFLSWLFRDDNYDEQQLAVDRDLIRLYYANHGYPDTQVTSVGEFDAARNAYFINFTINEGERYAFGNVGIETSIPGLNTNSLKGTVKTGQGSRYSYVDLQKTVEQMALDATDQGYSFADVRPRLDRDPASKTFNVTYLVDEGPRVYVERVNITGNQKTRDFVIRRELSFAEGDPFNRSVVLRGKRSIEALGFFKTVDITTEPGSAADKVVININVVEQSTGEYGLTAGYSTNDGLLGEISVTERNFLGRGQYVRAAIGATAGLGDGQNGGRSFDFSFTEPRFMGLKVSAGVDAYHRVVAEPTSSTSTYYGYTATGGQLRFGVPITRDLSATIFTGLEHKVFADGNAPTSQVVSDGLVRNKAWLGYTLTYNILDDQKAPTSGLIATFTQQYVGWDVNYVKSEARARYFIPLMEDSGLVGSIRGTAGIINNLDGGEVSATEAFPLGSTLVRGFQGRGVGPRLDTGEFLGATMYAGLSAEIEFPIPVIPETYGLRGAVWADAAWIDGTPASGGVLDAGSVDQKFKSSIGASLIWNSPFGPLRGDFAYVLNKATSDRTQVFSLTLSTLL